MSILDEFKKLQDEGMNITADEDTMEEIKKQQAMMDEYDKYGTINGEKFQIKVNTTGDEFPDGIYYDCEKHASIDDYSDGELVGEEMSPEDLVVKTFNNEYKKYHEEDLTIIKSNDYEPVVIKAYCPECGKEIISTSPVIFNPYTLDKICRYDCECGWKGNLDYAYPRFVMRNKNTGDEIEVYAK